MKSRVQRRRQPSLFDDCDRCGGSAPRGHGGEDIYFTLPSRYTARRRVCVDCEPLWRPIAESETEHERRQAA